MLFFARRENNFVFILDVAQVVDLSKLSILALIIDNSIEGLGYHARLSLFTHFGSRRRTGKLRIP